MSLAANDLSVISGLYLVEQEKRKYKNKTLFNGFTMCSAALKDYYFSICY